MQLYTIIPSTYKTLEIPQVMDELSPPTPAQGPLEPQNIEALNREWYRTKEENVDSAIESFATDIAFVISRQDVRYKCSWTNFNQNISTVNPEKTTIGYIPIIQAPAHELLTLNTVVERCLVIAQALGQKHVVLTVDEALYCKLMELKCKEILIVRLGGLHTALNFMKAIGQHTHSSGLEDIWVESQILGPNSAQQVMSGKSYARGLRAHKLTFQAMWRILMPQFRAYVHNENVGLNLELDAAADSTEHLILLLSSDEFRNILQEFVSSKLNPNFKFWWEYLEMVRILLNFTRAQRNGVWNLHLFSFQSMLLYLMRYDHTNYARWGTIYINEMHQLPTEIETEFLRGNFGSNIKFGQVDPDKIQEWLNGIGKSGVGITRTSTALNRWALSYNMRSDIARETRSMYNTVLTDSLVHNETLSGRKKRDNLDEDKIYSTLLRFNMFAVENVRDMLQNVMSKDLATLEIQESLLAAKEYGQKQLDELLTERLVPAGERKVKLTDLLRKNKALTFSSLYEVSSVNNQNEKKNILKADRSILQRLIMAYEAGRSVNLQNILKHELLPVPLSLAEMNSSLRTGNKSLLCDILIAGVQCPPIITSGDLGNHATLMIDGQALVVSIGKPPKALTFGDLADAFVKSVLSAGKEYHCVHILFDRYYAVSIKAGTRKRRTKYHKPVRRIIDSRDVPIPSDWNSFLSLSANKIDLSKFLSAQLLLQAPDDKTIIVAGGFLLQEQVESSSPTIDVASLECTHEEADTRIIFHCLRSNCESVVVAARDTDIFILLLTFHMMPCQKLWMKAGTAKQRKYIPIHTVLESLQFGENALQSLIGFHALTGSDTTSYIAGHTKRSAWKVFLQHSHLLVNLGDGDLTPATKQDAETFVCRIYNCETENDIDIVRSTQFLKSYTPEKLPPTSDALAFHIKRSHYQALVWKQSHVSNPVLPAPDTMGWKFENDLLIPLLMSLPPVPQSCLEIILCGCKTGCTSMRFKCKKANMSCISVCNCKQANRTCYNEQEEQLD